MSKLVRFDPFSELSTLQRQLFGDDIMAPVRSFGLPNTDVYINDDKELVVEAHLPNFKEDNIDISIDDGSLIIQAENHTHVEDKKRKYVVRESSSSFYRRVQLPERADVDNIKANLEDGILKVTMPLVALPTPKKIAIESKTKSITK